VIDIEHLGLGEKSLIRVTFTGRLTAKEYDTFLPHLEISRQVDHPFRG